MIDYQEEGIRRAMNGRQNRSAGSWFSKLGEPATIAMLLLFAATGGLYWATRALVSEAKHSFETGARAWMSPVAAGLVSPIENGKPINIGLRYANIGREPASDLNISYALRVFPNEAMNDGTAMAAIESSNVCAGVEPVKGSEVVYPGSGGARLILAIGPTDPKTGKNIALYDTYMAGNQTLAAQFCVAYKTFGVTHKSAFCYFYRSGATAGTDLNQCSHGNHAD